MLHCRQYSGVEEGIEAYYSQQLGSAVPRSLIRDLLTESLSTEALRTNLSLRGPQLSTCLLKGGYWLCAHAAGAIHHLPSLTVFKAGDKLDDLKVGFLRTVSDPITEQEAKLLSQEAEKADWIPKERSCS